MPKFAANLGYLFGEVPFLDRFAAAAAAGFLGVEYPDPYSNDVNVLQQRLAQNRLTQVLINSPASDTIGGGFGLAVDPDRRAAFAESVSAAIAMARDLDCRLVHVLAGRSADGSDRSLAEATYVDNLTWAAAAARPHGITCLIEPLNGGDAPGYFLSQTTDARRIIERVGVANLGLQLDLYHRQIMNGDLAGAIRTYLPIIGHIQIAGVPGRHEPDVGEINYSYLFDLLDDLGYQGWIGCEYRPRGATLAGLSWAARYGIGKGGAG